MRTDGLLRKPPTVAECIARPDNNFTVLRLGLALAVVISHAFSVTTGIVENEPLVRSTGFTLGEHAVNGFFAISGFLVTMSFDRRGWRDYAIARALRIAPGLIVATLVVAFVFGGLLTRLPLSQYVAEPGLWRFVSATLTSFKSNITMPGVFETNPFRFPIGTVWTLKYEVLCYAGVFLAGLAGLVRSRFAALALVIGLSLALAGVEWVREDVPKGIETALRLPLIFAVGAALYVWRDRAILSTPLLVGLFLSAAVAEGTFLYKTVLFVASAYGILWLALSPALTRFSYEPARDLSYGTYLYGWPVQQMLVALFPTASALALLGPAVAMTLAIAVLSWTLVEKPALGLKAKALGRRTLKTIEPAAP
jgi:peptidoglycan/LPS O-acetylase OafA/YrhL